MKTFLLIALLTGLARPSRPDTIDYWHIFYNSTRIGDFNSYGKNEINLKLDSIKSGDSIIVKYFCDTPCFDCITRVSVEDGQNDVIVTSQGKGTFTPISFALEDLKKTGRRYFEIFYFEVIIPGRAERKMIFTLKLE